MVITLRYNYQSSAMRPLTVSAISFYPAYLCDLSRRTFSICFRHASKRFDIEAHDAIFLISDDDLRYDDLMRSQASLGCLHERQCYVDIITPIISKHILYKEHSFKGKYF